MTKTNVWNQNLFTFKSCFSSESNFCDTNKNAAEKATEKYNENESNIFKSERFSSLTVTVRLICTMFLDESLDLSIFHHTLNLIVEERQQRWIFRKCKSHKSRPCLEVHDLELTFFVFFVILSSIKVLVHCIQLILNKYFWSWCFGQTFVFVREFCQPEVLKYSRLGFLKIILVDWVCADRKLVGGC